MQSVLILDLVQDKEDLALRPVQPTAHFNIVSNGLVEPRGEHKDKSINFDVGLLNASLVAAHAQGVSAGPRLVVLPRHHESVDGRPSAGSKEAP